MLLTIGERLHLLQNISPAEGRMSAIRMVRKFREELSVHPDEMAKVEFREEVGMVRWNPALDAGKEIETGEFIDKLILKTLDQMEKADPPRLKEEFISLYEKLGFVSSDN
jgi:hypothetical protein